MNAVVKEALTILCFGFLTSVFLLVSNKRPVTYIKSFRLQSLILALIIGIVSVYETYQKKAFEPMLLIFLLTFVLKVWYIPSLLENLRAKIVYRIEKDFFINIPASMIICSLILVFSWHLTTYITAFRDFDQQLFFSVSVTAIFIGLFFMVSRKKAISQIIGFLTIENGIFLGAVLLTLGMPMIVELGIFFDLLTAVLVMGIFVFRISDNFEHIDLNRLKNLKG